MDEQRIPDQVANREQAEGWRETVNARTEGTSDERKRIDHSDTQSGQRDEQAGGITNRPLDEEITHAVLIGGGIIVAAVAIVISVERPRRPHAHEASATLPDPDRQERSPTD